VEKHLYASMTWEEVNDAVLARRVVLVPVAAIEQHGPHLPIDMDNLAVTTLCDETARRNPGVALSVPAISYGFNEHNMDFPGTISVEMAHFVDYCFDVGRSFARQGFTRIVWVNGHGSNSGLCQLVARRLTNETNALSASIDWWNLIQETMQEIRQSGPGGIDHACEMETSVYLYIKPDLVRRDRIRDEYARARGGPAWLYPDLTTSSPVAFMNNWSRMSTSGVNGAPSLASAAKGERFLSDAIDRLQAIVREFRDLEVAPRVDHKVQAS
jgi:creatinine amidohydrolase